MGDNNEQQYIGNGVLLEKVDKFCYLGEMLNVDGRCVYDGVCVYADCVLVCQFIFFVFVC